jgi:hypothetical protein
MGWGNKSEREPEKLPESFGKFREKFYQNLQAKIPSDNPPKSQTN